jgi:hypothetical protein
MILPANGSAFDRLANQTATGYTFPMVIESIREFIRAVPFVPFEIHMASGERFTVPHPDFILVSPKGRFVIVMDERDHPYHLNAILIERASPVNGQRRKTGKRRA